MSQRQAARLAALIALPVALLAGLLTYRTLARAGAAPAGTPKPASTAPVAMPTRTLAAPDATACSGLIANLPEHPRGLQRRAVTAGTEQNAAYGDPPITIACGGPTPPIPPDGFIPLLGAPCWYADDSRPDATVWWTLDRRVTVTVTFPATYRNQGEGDLLQEFRDAILKWVPALPRPPSECALPSLAPS